MAVAKVELLAAMMGATPAAKDEILPYNPLAMELLQREMEAGRVSMK